MQILIAARWPLDQGTFLGYSEQAHRWAGRTAGAPAIARRSPRRRSAIWQQWTARPVTEFRDRRAARAPV